jgi:hypothetical protein
MLIDPLPSLTEVRFFSFGKAGVSKALFEVTPIRKKSAPRCPQRGGAL